MVRVWLMLITLLAVLLAGCTGNDGDDLQEAPSKDPVLVTDPDDYSYLENRTGSDGAHLHDYWGGKEAVLIMEQTEPMGALVVTEAVEVGKLRPDGGQTVLLGTSHVEVTIEWQDHPPVVYGTVELWVKTAAMNEPERVAEVQSGDTVTIESTNDDNDLPHQTLSGWEFSLVAYPDDADPGVGLVLFGADVSMTAVAHRGLDIPLFPGHPDHWNGADSLVLQDADREVFISRGAADGQGCLSPCLEMTSPRDGQIVPPETEHVEFVVAYDARTSHRLAWEFHGGDTWAWTQLTPTSEDGTTYTYVIPIERGMPDGPYAKQSLWEFRPYTPGRFDGVDPSAPSDGVFMGEYHVTLKAVRGATAP